MTLFLAAMMAIIVPLMLVVGFRMPARYGMFISLIVVGCIAYYVWGVGELTLAASVFQALHRALTIALILFGAVTLLYTLQRTGAMARIKYGFHSISPDMRVQAVLVGFAFISLMEGASGFGTPAIVAAPLMMALGFRPIIAATIALLGDTVAVTFGAVGTPLIVGLENVPGYSQELVQRAGAQVTLYDFVIGTILPVLLVAVLVVGFRRKDEKARWGQVVEIVPWALMVGFVYAVSAAVVVRVFGPEFTAIIASIFTLIFATITAKKGWMTPSATWRHHAVDREPDDDTEIGNSMSLLRAWAPYGAVVVLLLATRVVEPIKELTTTILDVSWHSILGIESINSTWQLLYSPGAVLIAAAVFAALTQSKSLRPVAGAMKQSVGVVVGALLALVPTLMMVQIFSNSGINTAGLASMPVYIGEYFANIFGDIWVLIAPLLGATGAFIAGSSTVSTLTLATVQDSVASAVGISQEIVLALQMIGAAAGNVVAIHNVVAVAAVVGLVHREGHIMRRAFPAVIVYLLIASLLGAVSLFFM